MEISERLDTDELPAELGKRVQDLVQGGATETAEETEPPVPDDRVFRIEPEQEAAAHPVTISESRAAPQTAATLHELWGELIRRRRRDRNG